MFQKDSHAHDYEQFNTRNNISDESFTLTVTISTRSDVWSSIWYNGLAQQVSKTVKTLYYKDICCADNPVHARELAMAFNGILIEKTQYGFWENVILSKETLMLYELKWIS